VVKYSPANIHKDTLITTTAAYGLDLTDAYLNTQLFALLLEGSCNFMYLVGTIFIPGAKGDIAISRLGHRLTTLWLPFFTKLRA